MEPASRYFLWEPPGRAIAVHLAFSVVDEIQEAIAQMALAAPVRGAEIGGLLLGKSLPGNRITVWIEGFEPAPCSYPRGASWLLTVEEQDEFRDWLKESRKGQVVGFFRSHTRKDLFLSEDDWAFVSHFFAEPSQVFLLVKPFTTRASLGGFFYWEDGSISRGSSYREFAFDRRELGGGESGATVIPQSEQWIRAEPDRGAEAALPVYADAAQPSARWKVWVAGAGLVMVTGTIAGYLWYTMKSAPARRHAPQVTVAEPPLREQLPDPAQEPKLNLSASESKGAITVRWDGGVPGKAAARQGILGISEGAIQKVVTLTPEQLRGGKLIYSRPVATSNLVSFRLNIETGQGASIQDAVMIIPREPVRAARPPMFSQSADLPAAVPAPAPKAAPAESSKPEQAAPLKLVRPAPRREP